MLKKAIVLLLGAIVSTLGAQASKAADEMTVYREILGRKVATRQDLYDLLVMQAGEFDKYPTVGARNAALKEKGFTVKDNGEVTRGEVSKAILEMYDLERGLFYTLTRWEFYALRDVQHAGIMEAKFGPTMKLSGRQLIGLLTLAAEKADEKSNYQKKSNP